jgi:uncharacterized protein
MAIACITGASSGIGMEFAKRLSRMGYELILVSRNTKALKKLAGTLPCRCKIISCDLSDENNCIKLAEYLKTKNLTLLINNAGFGDWGSFDNTDLNKELDMINVNIKALHILTKEILKDFKKKDRGYILNVASSAGLLDGGPYMATYYATKAYVTSLTSSIYEELKEAGSNVHISMCYIRAVRNISFILCQVCIVRIIQRYTHNSTDIYNEGSRPCRKVRTKEAAYKDNCKTAAKKGVILIYTCIL